MENNEFFFKKNVNQNEIRDVCDGKIYQNILNSEHGQLFKDNKAFSFCLNTDGISLCNKSQIIYEENSRRNKSTEVEKAKNKCGRNRINTS